MKKVISWLLRLNERLIRWQRKHPILDFFLHYTVFFSFIVLFICGVDSLRPGMFECDCIDYLCVHGCWAASGVLLGFFVNSLFVGADRCYILCAEKEQNAKEAAPDA